MACRRRPTLALTTLGRLPQPETLFLMARRGRAISTFNDLKGNSVGIGPEGSGTAYLMQQLLQNSDLARSRSEAVQS